MGMGVTFPVDLSVFLDYVKGRSIDRGGGKWFEK